MEFHIRKGSSDPILKLRLIDDGKNDKTSFNDDLETAIITFDMFDVITGEPVLLGETCNVSTRTKLYHQTTDEYYIIYRFTEEQTSEVGKYEGRITVQFTDGLCTQLGKLILPVKEKLYINII